MGLGSLCLSVVLAQARVPVYGGRLPFRKRQGNRGSVGGRGELARHCQEVPPACRGRRARYAADVPQDCLKLLSCTASYFRAESSDGSSLIPLPSPAASHEGGVVRYEKESLEFTSEFQHRAGRETGDRNGEVQGAT